MNTELMLDVGQANEIKLALRREGGWSNEEIKMLTERKGLLTQVREVVLGRAEIKATEYIVDFGKSPSIPNGWSILPDAEQLPNRVKGVMKFDPTKVRLHLDNGQKDGKWIEGNKLREKLADVSVYGAQLGDFYLANPHLIPEEWKGKAVFLWGTIYRHSGGRLYVRCLFWDGGEWVWRYDWLARDWFSINPAAASAS